MTEGTAEIREEYFTGDDGGVRGDSDEAKARQ